MTVLDLLTLVRATGEKKSIMEVLLLCFLFSFSSQLLRKRREGKVPPS